MIPFDRSPIVEGERTRMAEIHGGAYTSDADQVMVRRERAAIAVGILDEELRAGGFSPPGEEKAREFLVVRLSIEPIYGFYPLLNWYLQKKLI